MRARAAAGGGGRAALRSPPGLRPPSHFPEERPGPQLLGTRAGGGGGGFRLIPGWGARWGKVEDGPPILPPPGEGRAASAGGEGSPEFPWGPRPGGVGVMWWPAGRSLEVRGWGL